MWHRRPGKVIDKPAGKLAHQVVRQLIWWQLSKYLPSRQQLGALVIAACLLFCAATTVRLAYLLHRADVRIVELEKQLAASQTSSLPGDQE